VISVVAFLSVDMKTVNAAVAGIALTYAAQLSSSFQRMMTLISMTENIMTSFERISYYGTLEEEGSKRLGLYQTTPELWPSSGDIVFENVCMRYRDNLDLVLKDVSFHINCGEKIGICGRTGSGKSSMMNLLFRMVECSDGRILIDHVDISTIPINQLRSKLTIIPQDPVLFSGSLRLNLDPFDKNTDEELWNVLKKVHLIDDVVKWGEGLEYEVAEKGENISVGQRQLLCIARALIRDSKVVVLDEATANVDQESDKLIQQTVRDSFHGKTMLCIAHRLETIMESDRILLLDAGQVKEFDSPVALLQNPESVFHALVNEVNSSLTAV
jgi:ATP-binding cassette subfamily C (CFTR/MRP) protein 5